MMGTNHIEFDEYVMESETAYVTNRAWRRGQSYFNVLAQYRPDLSEGFIRGRKLDPFYRDEVIPDLLRWLKAHW